MPTRRTFLGSLGALSALPLAADALAQGAPAPQARNWDLSFLDRLTGRHKHVYDVGPIRPGETPLRFAANYLAAIEEVYGLRPPDVQLLVGIAGAGLPINVGDAAWRKHRLGERYNITDPATGQPSVRNIFFERPPEHPEYRMTVRGLQAKGVLFWMCNNALTALSARWAAEDQLPAAEIRADLVAALHPGVIIIPAHTMVLSLAQARGCSYEKV